MMSRFLTLFIYFIMNVVSIEAQDTIRIHYDKTEVSAQRFKGIRLKPMQIDHIFLIEDKICMQLNELDNDNFQIVKTRTKPCSYDILIVYKEINFKVTIGENLCNISNLTLSMYSYRHWKNWFRIKYAYLLGNGWQAKNSHIEPSSFNCIIQIESR